MPIKQCVYNEQNFNGFENNKYQSGPNDFCIG